MSLFCQVVCWKENSLIQKGKKKASHFISSRNCLAKKKKERKISSFPFTQNLRHAGNKKESLFNLFNYFLIYEQRREIRKSLMILYHYDDAFQYECLPTSKKHKTLIRTKIKTSEFRIRSWRCCSPLWNSGFLDWDNRSWVSVGASG